MNMASDFSLLHGTSFLTSFSFTLLRHSIMGGGNHHPFSLFVERREEEDPEVRSFLAGDDGRPTLLFVQTYRVHTPYKASPAARAC